MRILLDECVPWPMHRLLDRHICSTAQREGWRSIKNGELIKFAETRFDLFITADQNIRYQQNLSHRGIAILELTTNKLRRIEAAQDSLRVAVNTMKSGEFRILEIP